MNSRPPWAIPSLALALALVGASAVARAPATASSAVQVDQTVAGAALVDSPPSQVVGGKRSESEGPVAAPAVGSNGLFRPESTCLILAGLGALVLMGRRRGMN